LQRNVVVRAAIGGLASVAGGGKFGNGAVTAAFGYLFNDLAHCVKQSAAACLLGGTLLGSAALAGGPGTAAVGAAAGCVGSGLTVLSVCALSESSVGSRAGTAGDQYPIYRAVDPVELAFIEASGFKSYGHSPNMAGKNFALTLDGVYQFANSRFNAHTQMTVTATSVPESILNTGYFFNDPGGGMSTVHFSDTQLPRVYSTMTPIQILPRNR
jgi:hypothetical protein